MDNKLILPCDVENVSDGYHTFKDLYEHRCSLMVALMLSNPGESWWSRNHADDSSFPGWIIVGLNLACVKPITYHIPEKWIDCLQGQIENLDKSPPWDGHTPHDVLARLSEWIKSSQRVSNKERRE